MYTAQVDRFSIVPTYASDVIWRYFAVRFHTKSTEKFHASLHNIHTEILW